MATIRLEKISKNWVWIALLFTVLASLYVSKFEDESAPVVAMPEKKLSQMRKQTSTNTPPALASIGDQRFTVKERLLKQDHAKNLFKVFKNPVPVVNIAPPNKLQKLGEEEFIVPPVPFSYVGKMDDSPKGSVVYLTANDKLYTVAKGEKVDAFWRFDEEFALSLQFTYLPNNKQQILIKNQVDQPVKSLDNVQQ